MKNYHIFILLLAITTGIAQRTNAASYTWTGSVSTAWNNSSNWSPSTGFPDSTDNATIVTATNEPLLDQNRKVYNLTINSGTLDLNGYDLEVLGTGSFWAGIITNGNFKPRGVLANFSGTLMDCSVNAVCGYIRLSGSTFEEDAYFEDTGYASGNGEGGCVFNGNVTIKHTGSNTYFMLALNDGDVFNGNLVLINESTHEIHVGRYDTTWFNGNVEVNSTSTGGITFGYNGGMSYLATSKTISVGSTGFTNDVLLLKNFNQEGTTSQTLNLTGSAVVNMNGSTFNGALTVSSPGFLIKNNTFNGNASLTKTGTANYHSDGGNTFNSTATISNSGSSGRIRLATTTPDNFIGNATFNSTGQDLQVAYSGQNTFSGDITINSNKVVFNTSNGRVTFTGANSQSINGSFNYSFKKLNLNKSSNHVTANTTLSVDDSLTLNSGNLITTSTNLLTMKAASSVTGASNSSFVSGPVKKVGNTSFEFPVGKGEHLSSVEITAPSNSTHAFVAEFFEEEQSYGTSMDTSLSSINPCNYWTLERVVGSSNVKVTLSWNSQSCNITYPGNIRVSNWNGSSWINLGSDSYSGSLLQGSVKGASNPSAYTAFCLANTPVAYSGAPDLEELSNYALFSGQEIFSDSLTVVNGKVGSVNDVIQVLSNDSILTNNSGSVPDALISLVQSIMYANGLAATLINDSIDGKSYSEGVYSFVGNAIVNDSIVLSGDSSSVFIFNISRSLTVDSGAIVYLNGVHPYNVFWNVNDKYIGNEFISFPGIVMSKMKITAFRFHNPMLALMSLDSIILFAHEDDILNNIFYSSFEQFTIYNTVMSGCNFVYDGCNEIRNSHFENWSVIPGNWNGIFAACPWNSATGTFTSTDYYHSFNAGGNVDVPDNRFGCENDHSSPGNFIPEEDAYAGIYAFSNVSAQFSQYREYLHQQLNSPLTAGLYYGEMFVSLADRSSININSMGMHFSNGPIVNAFGSPIPVLAQVQSDLNNQLSVSIGWERISGCFQATGGESHVVIGNFNDNSGTITANNTNPNNCPIWNQFPLQPTQSYYYIDDPAVVPFTVNAGPNQTVDCDETVQLGLPTCINSLNTGQFTYLWVELQNPLGVTLSNYTIFNPTVTFYNITGTTLTQVYQVTVTSPGGCQATDIVEIIVESCAQTPCDDGESYCFQNYTVTGNENWVATSNPGCGGNVITIEFDLIIPANTSLILNGVNVLFGPLGKVIVQRGTVGSTVGGLLTIVSGSILEPSSEHCMWQGIEVWGHSTQDHLNVAHGLLAITESEVNYAHIGVYMGRRTANFPNGIATFTGGRIEGIEYSSFKDNYVGIRFPGGYDTNLGTMLDINNNDFFCEGAMRDPIYLGSRSLYFIDINQRRPTFTFTPSNPWGDPTIKENSFFNTPTSSSNSTIAIRCNSCINIPFVYNEFIDVDRGIFFLSSNGPGQANIVTERSSFRNVNIGIYNRANRSNTLYLSTFQDGIGAITQGIFNEFSVGTLIQENSIHNFFGGINVSRSGINHFLPLRIWENFIDNCPLSLLASGNNHNSFWWCNSLFNYHAGFAWTLFDISSGGGSLNARIQPQGVCGALGFPPSNTFNITTQQILDINNLTSSTNNFTYNIRTGSTAVYVPNPVAGLVTVNNCIMFPTEVQFCGQMRDPFRVVSELLAQRDTTTDSTLISILNAEIYNYYVRVNEIDSAISFIDTMHVEGIQQMLLDLYFIKQDVDSVRNIIASLPSGTQEEVEFIRFINVMTDLMEDSLTVFEMDSIQLATVAELALGTGEAALLAQGVLNTLYEKPINVPCEMVNACEDSRFAQPVKVNKTLQLLKNYPNPCSQITTFELPEEAKDLNGLKLKIFNQLGKLVAEIPVNETTKVEFDCTDLTNGLYVYYFIGPNIRSASGKMVVIKN